MPIDTSQLRDCVIVPVLNDLTRIFEKPMNSQAAVNLLLGTAAQESYMGTYLTQLNNGPARGIFQVEQPTHDWVLEWGKKHFSHFIHRLKEFEVRELSREENMLGNLFYATAIARLNYWRIPQALPSEHDVRGLANYYKTHWNTHLGKATVTEFIANYERFVA